MLAGVCYFEGPGEIAGQRAEGERGRLDGECAAGTGEGDRRRTAEQRNPVCLGDVADGQRCLRPAGTEHVERIGLLCEIHLVRLEARPAKAKRTAKRPATARDAVGKEE